MITSLLALSILAGFAFFLMTPGERARLLRAIVAVARNVHGTITYVPPACEPFREALHARTRWTLVTPALIAVNATIFVFMLFGAGALTASETLVGWGANFGPRTANGEWWRLVTAMFVHSGVLHLLATMAGLIQAGLLLERLVGHFAFATVYLAAGIVASLASLSAPVAVSAGASGAIFGIYGLLLASSLWGALHQSAVTVPLAMVSRLAPAAAVFMLYNVGSDHLETAAELAGFAAGFVCGVVLTRDVSRGRPSARRVAIAWAAVIAIVAGAAVLVRGVTDVRPDIERVVALEDRTASVYRAAVDRFRSGRITAEALAALINQTIRPEIQAAGARLTTLEGVPPEHQPLVAVAEEFLRLRDESWRLRAEGLHKANMLTLREADRAERASLDLLRRIRPPAKNRARAPTTWWSGSKSTS
jgi:membrane associated rhomboid family serine protease